MKTDETNILTTKKSFRSHCFKKLQKVSTIGAYKRNKSVMLKLYKVLKDLKFKTLLVYLPLAHEVDLRKNFRNYRQKSEVFVPFMEGISFKVVKYRLPLFEKKFSIKEPRNSLRKTSRIDVMIVPVIGVDGDLRRIGFGKGMYDRYFCTLKKKPLVIFVQLDLCCTKLVLTKSYDIQADIYITPQKIIKKRGIHDNRNSYSSRNSDRRHSIRLFGSKKDK